MNKLNGAEGLRTMANGLSIARALGGVVLGYQIFNNEYPTDSVLPLAETIALASTDYLDGLLARRATNLDGQKSRLGAWLDQMTDKIFTTSIVAGVAAASISQGRPAIGTAVAASGAVFLARDAYVTVKRLQAERANALHDQPPIETKAKIHGKIKAFGQFLVLGALTSPVMEPVQANWAAAGALAATAGLAVASGLKYRSEINAGLGDKPPVTPVLDALPLQAPAQP